MCIRDRAITGVVASGVLPYKRAVTLAAAMNLLGVVAMTALCPAVADTISGLVNFAAVDSACLLYTSRCV